ncbi:uncharacterized [Tachysurus ichikawai]
MRGRCVNRSSPQEIGTKQPVTHGGIEVILSRCCKRRRGLQALLAKQPKCTLVLMSYSRPCVSSHLRHVWPHTPHLTERLDFHSGFILIVNKIDPSQ